MSVAINLNGDHAELYFSIGRKKSEDVAKWFNNEIPENRTTFGHEADELNFAFIGTLVLDCMLTGIDGSGIKRSFVFDDITLAQGSTGTSNNWWFGGKKCWNIEDNRVQCTGHENNFRDGVFRFGRGGNDTNGISVYVSANIGKTDDTADWMQNRIAKTTRLNQIVMPGSHDAGISELHHSDFLDIVSGNLYVKTQEVCIGEQLLCGARYFDIRIDYDHDELVTYHRSGKLGTNGQRLAAVMEEVTDFLNRHSGETAILKISHIRNDSGHSEANTKQKIKEFIGNSYSGMLLKKDNDCNMANLTVSDTAGKILLACDYGDYFNPSEGWFLYRDVDNIASEINGGTLNVMERYSDTSDFNKMEQDQLNKWSNQSKNIGTANAGLFALSWTLTETPIIDLPIEDSAAYANNRLADFLNAHSNLNMPNIVYIDFINYSLGALIVEKNT
jgi:hypothetical protein